MTATSLMSGTRSGGTDGRVIVPITMMIGAAIGVTTRGITVIGTMIMMSPITTTTGLTVTTTARVSACSSGETRPTCDSEVPHAFQTHAGLQHLELLHFPGFSCGCFCYRMLQVAQKRL